MLPKTLTGTPSHRSQYLRGPALPESSAVLSKYLVHFLAQSRSSLSIFGLIE